MKFQQGICELCGVSLRPSSLGKHRGSGPCRARVAEHGVYARGLTVLRGKVDANLRHALERLGVEHEVSAAVFESTRERGRYGSRWHAAQKNALCVPLWVAALVEVGATERIDPFEAVQRALSRGQEFQQAVTTNMALGGTRAVTQYLHDEGFYERSA